MSLAMTDSKLFHLINSNPATIYPESIYHVTIVAVSVVALITLYFLSESSVSRPLTDKAGNRIPLGPRGLPIVG